MVMFGKAIERIGAKPVRPRLFHRMIINVAAVGVSARLDAVGGRPDR